MGIEDPNLVSLKELVEIVNSESERLFEAIGLPWKKDNSRGGARTDYAQRFPEQPLHVVCENDLATGHFLVEVRRRWIQVPLQVFRLLNGKPMVVLFNIRRNDFKGDDAGFIKFVKDEILEHESQRLV